MSDHTPLSRLQDTVDAEALQRHLQWFSAVPRDTGGDGEDRAAAYLAAELESAGVPVVVHEFDAFLSYPREASLRVTEPATREFRASRIRSRDRHPTRGCTANWCSLRDRGFDPRARQDRAGGRPCDTGHDPAGQSGRVRGHRVRQRGSRHPQHDRDDDLGDAGVRPDRAASRRWPRYRSTSNRALL